MREPSHRAAALGAGVSRRIARSHPAGPATARRTRRIRPRVEGVTTFQLAGVEVPRIGLGTNRLTRAREHVRFMRDAVAAGVRHIDTAHLYTGGESERAIGVALDGAGEDVLVATKGGFGAGEGRPGVLTEQIEQSLRALRTERSGSTTCTGSTRRPRWRTASARSGVRRPRRDPARRPLRGERRADRARAAGGPIAAVQDRVQPRRARTRRGDRPLPREGIAFVPVLPVGGDGGPAIFRRLFASLQYRDFIKLASLLGRAPVVAPDPGHALARAPPGEPRGARARPRRSGPARPDLTVRAQASCSRDMPSRPSVLTVRFASPRKSRASTTEAVVITRVHHRGRHAEARGQVGQEDQRVADVLGQVAVVELALRARCRGSPARCCSPSSSSPRACSPA